MIRHTEDSIEQCRLNVLAVLAYHNCPGEFDLIASQPDRIIVLPYGALQVWLHNMRLAGTLIQRTLIRRLHGPTAYWAVQEAVPFGSLNITGHRIQVPDTAIQESWEIDLDHGNPAYVKSEKGHQDLAGIFTGLASLLVHGVEVAWPGATDPFRMRGWLLKRGIQVPLVGAAVAV